MLFNNLTENMRACHFFCIAAVLSGICAVLHILSPDDVFERYAPAAEAFARGDWQYAFHPRFGVCFTSLAGIAVRLFHCSGAAACQMISAAFFSLSVFPLYELFQEIWGRHTAFWGTFCYIFCSHLLRYAGSGMRDTGKILALAMIADVIISLLKKPSWKSVFLLSGGCALLTVIRGEGCLVALVCGAASAFMMKKEWKKILVGIALYCILIAPQCLYNYCRIGYPVPELRHGKLLRQMLLLLPGTENVQPEKMR